jgi:alpha-N-arabinofuranosidase
MPPPAMSTGEGFMILILVRDRECSRSHRRPASVPGEREYAAVSSTGDRRAPSAFFRAGVDSLQNGLRNTNQHAAAATTSTTVTDDATGIRPIRRLVRVLAHARRNEGKRMRLTIVIAAAAAIFAAPPARPQPPPFEAHVTIHADRPGATIDENIYGQFMEHLGRNVYEGIWVGEDSPIPNTRGYRNDVLAALRKLGVPVLRWPGGCFADEYHWRDGIGPRDRRPKRVNTFWGGVIEPNTFGTHEFFELAELLGAKTYLAVNVGSGTVQEMSDWIEYITSPSQSTLAEERRRNGRDRPWKLDYVGVGNEPWGCGGDMRAEYYSDVYRRYALNVKTPKDNTPVRIASGASGARYDWTETLMSQSAEYMGALSFHQYTLPTGNWERKGPALGFAEADWIATLAQTLKMDQYLTRHSAIMDKHDPKKRVALYVDEWGTWYDVEPGTNPGFLFQQNTLRDAVVAALNFNVFHAHADRVRMTNIAQMINVLQAMVLTDKEKMLVTPTYHAFEMYRPFRNATVLPADLTAPSYKLGATSIPAISVSAARTTGGATALALVNTDPAKPARVTVAADGARYTKLTGRVLTASAPDAHNTFDEPESVRPATYSGASRNGERWVLALPPKSVVVATLE